MKNLKQRQHQEDPENGMGLASVFRVQNSNRLNEKSQAYGVDVLSLEMHDWAENTEEGRKWCEDWSRERYGNVVDLIKRYGHEWEKRVM